ncbi:MAG TPA: MFS transporter [Candidatus Saccharimonadales bacterium]|nr:MFS transporter [Candidatus Saccharimonadales bacterium]
MKKGIKKLLGARQLLRAMGSQSVSTYANQVIAFVVPWLVLTKTGSAASAGIVAFAMSATMLIGGLLGGLATDRLGGRKVSVIADIFSMITALGLATALFLDFFAIWFVIITQILGVLFDSPGQVAKNTTVPAAAKEGDVPVVRAMGLQQTLQNIAMFIGPISAGVLVAVLTESYTLILAAVLFLIAVYLVWRMPKKLMVHEHPMSFKRAYLDMKDAMEFIVNDPFLGKMQIFGPLFAFVVVPASTIIFPAWFVLNGQSSASLGAFLGIQAIGGIIGGFIFAALAPKVSQQRWLGVATALYALSFLAFSYLQPGSLFTYVIAFFAGIVFTGLMAIPYSAFYIRTPERLLGRTGSLGIAAGSLVAAIASLFFGWLISVVSPAAALVAGAIIMGIVALGVMVLPFMKYLDLPPAPEADSKKAS